MKLFVPERWNFFFHHYVILTGQSNMSISFRVRLITVKLPAFKPIFNLVSRFLFVQHFVLIGFLWISQITKTGIIKIWPDFTNYRRITCPWMLRPFDLVSRIVPSFFIWSLWHFQITWTWTKSQMSLKSGQIWLIKYYRITYPWWNLL